MTEETKPEINQKAMILEKHLRILFKDNADTTAYTGRFDKAMTEDTFVKAMMPIVDQRDELLMVLEESLEHIVNGHCEIDTLDYNRLKTVLTKAKGATNG